MTTTSNPTIQSREIRIYLNDAEEDEDVCWWKWTVEDVNSIAKCSELLVENLANTEDSSSTYWRVSCNDEDEGVALASIIRELPGKGDDRLGDLTTKHPDYGFTMLSRLANVIWNYKCLIPPKIASHALEVYNKYHPKGPAVYWMFIALVFGGERWEAIFRDLSVEVLVHNDPPFRDQAQPAFLPQEFQNLVSKAHREKVSITWLYIIKSCMALVKTGVNIQKITDDFLREDLDVEELDPEALPPTNASNLLAILEASLRSNDEILETDNRSSKTAERPNATDGKGGGFGAMVRYRIEKRWEKRKNSIDTQNQSGSRSSIESEEQKAKLSAIEETTATWRIDNLGTKISFNSEFGKLRLDHFQNASSDDSFWVSSRNKSGSNGSSRKPHATKATATASGPGPGTVNRNHRANVLKIPPGSFGDTDTAESASSSEIGGPISVISGQYPTNRHVSRKTVRGPR